MKPSNPFADNITQTFTFPSVKLLRPFMTPYCQVLRRKLTQEQQVCPEAFSYALLGDDSLIALNTQAQKSNNLYYNNLKQLHRKRLWAYLSDIAWSPCLDSRHKSRSCRDHLWRSGTVAAMGPPNPLEEGQNQSRAGVPWHLVYWHRC